MENIVIRLWKGAGWSHPSAGRRPPRVASHHLLESSSHESLEAKQSMPTSILSRFDLTVHTRWRRGSMMWRFLAPYSTSTYIRTPKAPSLRHSTPWCFILSTQIRICSVPLVHLVLVLVYLVVIRRGREKRREWRRSRICWIFLDIVLLQYLVHHLVIFRCINYYSKFFIYLISLL